MDSAAVACSPLPQIPGDLNRSENGREDDVAVKGRDRPVPIASSGTSEPDIQISASSAKRAVAAVASRSTHRRSKNASKAARISVSGTLEPSTCRRRVW